MRVRTLPLLAALSVFTLFLASCSGGSGSGSGGTTPPPVLHYAYSDGVVGGNATILSFPLTSTGLAVVPTVAATLGSADIIRNLRTDGKGNLYAMTLQSQNFSKLAVYVYAISSGQLTLQRSFNYWAGYYADGMTVDSSGNVYVSMQNGPVMEFTSTASGSATPSATFNVGREFPQMATDSSGNIYGLTTNAVYEYDPGFSSLTPIKTFNIPGSITGDPDLLVAGNGTVYVLGCVFPNGSFTGYSQILEFVGGSATPTYTIAASNNDLGLEGAIGLDTSSGLIWANTPLSSGTGRVFSGFPAGTGGALTPSETFTSPSPDFTNTWSPALLMD